MFLFQGVYDMKFENRSTSSKYPAAIYKEILRLHLSNRKPTRYGLQKYIKSFISCQGMGSVHY